MRVIVVGAGEVGRTIAANLANSHDVAVVDQDADLVEELTYSMEVLAVHGDGTDLSTLKNAGIDEADMVLACTDDDETNIVICGTAKTIGNPFTVARVKRRSLLETWRGADRAFDVDFMVCTDLLAAEAVFRISGVPGAQDVDTFAGGIVRMAEFEVTEDSPVSDMTVEEADRFDSLTFAAIFRGDDVVIPRGETPIDPGDRIVVIGSPESVQGFAREVTERGRPEEVVIIGGSEIGFQAARLFQEHGYRPKLIEQDDERAREIAEALSKTLVMKNDATDVEFLQREHVNEAGIVVAALDSDEKNLLVCLLADRLGADRTVAMVDQSEYGDLFEAVGVDVAISPREETAEEITRFTRAGATEKVAMLEHDRAEILEIEIKESSTLAGRTISDAMSDLPNNVVIGAITRAGTFVTPRGDTVVEVGDHVVLFVDVDSLDTVVEKIC